MVKEKKLFKDMITYIVGNFGSKIISILMLKFYTSYLTTGEYGTIDILTTTVSLLMPVVSLQLSEAVFRMIIGEKSEQKKQKYISTVFTALIINSCILFFIVYISFKVFDFKYQYSTYIVFMIVFGIIYEAICQLVRGLNMNKLYAGLGLLFTLVFTSLNIIYIATLNQGIKGYLKSQILAYCITGIIGILGSKVYRYYKFSISKFELKELLRYSIPLIPNMICWWILNVSDRYFLLYYSSNQSVGIYAFAGKITNLMYVINSIFMLAWQSNSIETYKEENRDKYYSKVFYYYYMIQNTLVIGFSIVSYLLVFLLGGAEYRESYKYIPMLALAILFNTFATYYANNYIILKKTKEIMKTTIIAAVLNVILNFIFVPRIEIYGAILATIISYMVVWLIRVCDREMTIKITLNKVNLVLNLLLTVLTVIINIIELPITLKFAINTIILIIFVSVNIIVYIKVIRDRD